MKQEDIHLLDWKRLLIGDAPFLFLIEVWLRSLVMYVILLLIVQWLGKRMSGQLSIAEVSVMLMLGAVVSSPMQLPDRGIVLGLFVLVLIVLFQRGINTIVFKNRKMEVLTQSTATMLVKNGVLQLDALSDTRISRQQLFSVLRGEGIIQLGCVKRVYLEAHGGFSVYKERDAKAGLSIAPLEEDDHDGYANGIDEKQKVCSNCGFLQEDKTCAKPLCPVCTNEDWIKAVT